MPGNVLMIWSARVLISSFHAAASLGWSFQNGGSGAPIRDCSCTLTSAVDTRISLAGTSRVPPSSEKAALGTARPTARTARCHLKFVFIGRLLLIEREFPRKDLELSPIVAIFRVCRNSGPGLCLARDDFSSNRHPAPSFCLSMIFSENRYPLFRIML